VQEHLIRKQAYITANKQSMENNLEYHKHRLETARPKGYTAI
jgi:hypothetical protein